MTAALIVAGCATAIALLYWLGMVYVILRTRWGMPRLEELTPPEPERWPKLSVIVPARNEAEDCEAAVQTLLDENYPELEIVLVDDRSTDATGEILDRLAAGDARATALHITELPEGWLGKVHALDRGLTASTGAFVLFTDADVHFRRGTLRQAVAWALAQELDFLTALPTLWPTSLFLDSMIATFIRHLLVGTRPWNLGNSRSKAFFGVGAFNLVRRSAFDATEGFAWLRMETADDAGLGYMMKKSGAKCSVVSAFEHVGLYWYHTPGEAARGAEKGFASVLRCSLVRGIVMALVMLTLEISPMLVLLPLIFGMGIVGVSGIGVFVIFLIAMVLLARWARVRLLPGLLGPLTAVFMAWVFVRVAVVGRRRGGALWRGTLYTSEELLTGRRVPLP